MKQRYIPFGYAISGGENVCHAVEESAVRNIFEQYQNGATYQAIASKMSDSGIRYHPDKPLWNKNMVKRILENLRYLGTDDYPAIITAEQFERTTQHTSAKTESFMHATPCIVSIKPTTYCAECGGRLMRKMPIRGYGKWYCETDGCATSICITDTLLKKSITARLNRVIESPSLIEIPTAQEMSQSLEITRLQNEINREIDKTDCNEDYAKALIMACATEKYNLCNDGSTQRIGREIKAIFENHEQITEFDTALFTATVSRVLVHKDGGIGIKLKNNQILGKGK